MKKQEEICRENIQDAISSSSYKTIESYFELNKSQYSSEDLGSLLLEAILVKKLQLVKLFVKLGVDFNEGYQYGSDIEYPMNIAIKKGGIKIVNYFDAKGIKPLKQYYLDSFLTSEFKSKEGCELIIFLMKNKYVTDVNDYRDGDSHLFALIQYSFGSSGFIEALVYALKNGADVNKFMYEDGRNGITILDYIKKYDGYYSVYLKALAQAEKEILDNDLNSNLPKRRGGILKV